MPRILIAVKNDNSVETWTMDGGKQYLVVKKDEIIGIRGEKQIEEGYRERKADAIKQGQKDAWELLEQFIDMTVKERKECFGVDRFVDLVRNYDCEDAIADLAAWKARKEEEEREARKIHLKDYVRAPKSSWLERTGVDRYYTGVVVNVCGSRIRVMRCDGLTFSEDADQLIKTGETCKSLDDFLDGWKED